MIAYKYVDHDVAEAVAQGSLRIGTLRGYAKLENSRRDDLEGSISRKVDFAHIADTNTDAVATARLRSLGLQLENCKDITIRNMRSTSQTQNLYCFCMTRNLNEKLSQESRQAVFEVKGVKSLAGLLASSFPGQLGRYVIRKMAYLPRNVDWTDDTAIADPFIKDPVLSYEDEVRICWEPARNDASPFNTDSNARVASLLLRVA